MDDAGTEIFLRVPRVPDLDITDAVATADDCWRDYAFHGEILSALLVVVCPFSAEERRAGGAGAPAGGLASPSTLSVASTATNATQGPSPYEAWRAVFGQLKADLSVNALSAGKGIVDYRASAASLDVLSISDGAGGVWPFSITNSAALPSGAGGSASDAPRAKSVAPIETPAGHFVYVINTPLSMLPACQQLQLTVTAHTTPEAQLASQQQKASAERAAGASNAAAPSPSEVAELLADSLKTLFVTERGAAVGRSFRRMVELRLRVVPPPRVTFNTKLSGDAKYVLAEAENAGETPIVLCDVQLFLARENGESSPLRDAFRVAVEKEALPMRLSPSERHAFVFAIEPTPLSAELLQDGATGGFSTVLAVTWSGDPIMSAGQRITCQHMLMPTHASAPGLAVSLSRLTDIASASMAAGFDHGTHGFGVSVTIINGTNAACELSLVMPQPKSSSHTRVEAIGEDERLAEHCDRIASCASLVCLQKKIYLGRFEPFASKVVSVGYHAFRPGVYELSGIQVFDHVTSAILPAKCPPFQVYVRN